MATKKVREEVQKSGIVRANVVRTVYVNDCIYEPGDQIEFDVSVIESFGSAVEIVE